MEPVSIANQTFIDARARLEGMAGGNITTQQLRSIEKAMGMPMFTIAQDYLGVKISSTPPPQHETEEQKTAREVAEEKAREACVTEALRVFSFDKACRLVAAMGFDPFLAPLVDSLSVRQVGELYRIAVQAFMDAFSMFNGMSPSKGGEEGKASAG